MRDEAYDAAIINAFGYPSLRTAFVIDDQFPSYPELVRGIDPKKPGIEVERASELYQFFHHHKIPCDIANWAEEFRESDIDRIRKTDLIVLDYNLGADDIEKSIDIMRRLSESSHFNTVILYTQSINLDEVWEQIAAAMRGGWRSAEDIVEEAGVEDLWNEHVDTILAEEIVKPLLDGVITGNLTPAYKKAKGDLLKKYREAKIDPRKCSNLFDAALSEKIRQRFYGSLRLAEFERRDIDGVCDGDVRWVQAGQCFIAIMGKMQGASNNAPGRVAVSDIFKCLDDALKSWCPNILQIVLAEIQNVLELNALSTARLHLNDKSMQLGLAYYLLWSMSEGVKNEGDASALPALHLTIDKLVETIRFRVANDPDLIRSASTVLSKELKRVGWIVKDDEALPRTFDAATKLARQESHHDEAKVLLDLNEFLASEPFRRQHPTTGTILHDEESGDFIMCASPACDMVSRKPNSSQKWLDTMHPLRPLVGVHLHGEETPTTAIMNAELGKYVFFSLDGKMTALSMMPAEQPVTEFFFVNYEADIIFEENGNKYIEAFRLSRSSKEDGKLSGILKPVRFRLVNQVRDAYANRFLQMTGNHLSRIGVDFVNFTPPPANPEGAGKNKNKNNKK